MAEEPGTLWLYPCALTRAGQGDSLYRPLRGLRQLYGDADRAQPLNGAPVRFRSPARRVVSAAASSLLAGTQGSFTFFLLRYLSKNQMRGYFSDAEKARENLTARELLYYLVLSSGAATS